MAFMTGILAALLTWFGGFCIGHWAAIRSLLIGADSPDRTPHKLGQKFYYLVPESEYNLMSQDATAKRVERDSEAFNKQRAEIQARIDQGCRRTDGKIV